MKIFIKNSYLFLIFFILFLTKDFLYGLIKPKDKISIDSLYILRLEEELDSIKEFTSYKLNGRYGKVLYQNPYQVNDELFIAVVTDNLSKHDYVINNDGLIGVIDKIYQNFVIVKMLTNSKMFLQVKVGNCYGILNNGIVSNLDSYCEVNLNDKVYTSNLGHFDEQILVGFINRVENDQNLIENKYYLKYSVDFNALNYVAILSKVSS